MCKQSLIFGFFACLQFAASAQSSQKTNPDSIIKIINMVATWQINEFNSGRIKSSEIGWENAALYTGIIDLKKVSKDPRYNQFLYQIGETHQWNTGPFRFFADDYCVAQMYTAMYLEHREPKMILKWKALADSIVAKRFDEPLTITPDITHKEWAWCDALFMGPNSLALLSKATGNSKYLNKADSLWWKTSAFLYDEKNHLFYRDSRFFTQREKNGEKIFWSRGNSWVLAGLARMMDNMPKNYKSRAKYEIEFKQMAERIAGLQQADGSWHASLLDPITFNEKESSGTGFYCYAFAWGVKNKLLPAQKFMPVISRAWNALVASVHPDGKLGYVQNVGSGPIAANYDSTNTYGVGSFLLAGSELYQLLKTNPKQ